MPTAQENFDILVSSLFSDNAISSILRSSENCLIKQYLGDFAYASRNSHNEKGWNSFICLHDREPETLTSKIVTGGYSYNNLRRIKTLEKANLVPKIRFYKVIVDANTRKPTSEIKIQFPDSNKENLTSLMSNRDERGDDIGIKSFTFDIKNQNPFAASRIVESTLVLTMVSGESLTKRRPQGFKFADLIIRNNRVDPDSFDSDYYQIKAVVGYEIPPGDSIDAGLKRDLRQNQLSMIMTLIDYDINFEQNGFLTLTLNYVSRIEQQFQSVNKYNVFEDKEFERGSAADRKAKRKDIRAQKTKRAKASKDEVKAIALAEARHTKDINSIPNIGETYTLKGVGGYVKVGADLNEELEMSEEDYYFKVRLANEKRDAAIEAARQKTLNVISDSDLEISKKEAELVYAQNQNRVEKYSQILDNLFSFGKIRKIVIPKEAMVIYGQAFEDELSAYTEEMFASALTTGTSGLPSIQALLLLVEQRRADIYASIQDQIITSAPVTSTAMVPLQAALDDLAKQIAAAAGRSAPVVQDILEASRRFDPTEFARTYTSTGTAYEYPTADSVGDDRTDKHIYYFYLGDLIEQAMSLNLTDQKLFDDKLALCLGNFSFTETVPLISSAPGGVTTSGTTSTEKVMNLADYPITLEMFLKFFKANIVDKSLDVYPLADFVRDTTQRLVMPSLNSECFGNGVAEGKTIKTVSFELPEMTPGAAGGDSREPITNGRYGDSSVTSLADYYKRAFQGAEYNMRFDVEPLMIKSGGLGKNLFGNNDLLSRKKATDRYGYFLTYATTRSAELSFMGNEKLDINRGIYHFYLGSDRGLVKNIDFVKQSDSQIALIMAERAMTKGDEKIELWRNFSANLSLVGNTLLRPGCFIYINPTISGLGDPSKKGSLGRAMGLGGYYMVLRVSNTIDESGWTTSAEAVWQSVPPGT